MTDKARVVQAIFRAVDEVNELLPEEQQSEKSLDTVLFGKNGRLDSLGIVIFFVAVEKKIEKEFGVVIMLTDEKIMSQKNNPLQTIETLVDYVSMHLEEKLNG
ncbi:MAG: acyl carrier protein [Candidatus Omnitrophica bacterium]|nr:acyl carrier protein [Candidatus Omnitrophota bacterium]